MIVICNDIGSIVRYKGVRLKVIKAVEKCRGCYFRRCSRCPVEDIGVCCHPWRADNIIFRKVDLRKKENNHAKITKKWQKKNSIINL